MEYDSFGKVLDNPLLKAMKAFDHRHWPLDRQMLGEYGIVEIKVLFDAYKNFLPDISQDEILT
eukprot:scaffold277904_cov33-Tisochrysis_lutea.AAC.1